MSTFSQHEADYSGTGELLQHGRSPEPVAYNVTVYREYADTVPGQPPVKGLAEISGTIASLSGQRPTLFPFWDESDKGREVTLVLTQHRKQMPIFLQPDGPDHSARTDTGLMILEK